MKKIAANVHYLNPPHTLEGGFTSTTSEGQLALGPFAQDQLIKRLEQHLERMEQEFKRTLKQISRQEGNKKGPSDHSHLITNLEEKLKRLSEEVHESTNHKKKIPSLFSAKTFKDFLQAAWRNNGHEENFEFDEFGLDPAFAEKVKPFFDFLYHDYWRVNVKGIHHIPRMGRGLIVANHSGTVPYDGAMIRLSVLNDHPSRRDVRFLVEDFVYHFPFLGTFMYRTGGVRACPENAERLLSKDHLVAVFPEGVKGIGKEFKNRYRLQRFGRGGFIKLALRTEAPIIPTAVVGAEEIHPIIYKSTALAKPLGIPYIPITPTLPLLGPLGLIPLPSKWTIVFGEPILLADYGPRDAEDQLLVNQLSEKVRLTIQERLTEEIRNRRSVWFG